MPSHSVHTNLYCSFYLYIYNTNAVFMENGLVWFHYFKLWNSKTVIKVMTMVCLSFKVLNSIFFLFVCSYGIRLVVWLYETREFVFSFSKNVECFCWSDVNTLKFRVYFMYTHCVRVWALVKKLRLLRVIGNFEW